MMNQPDRATIVRALEELLKTDVFCKNGEIILRGKLLRALVRRLLEDPAPEFSNRTVVELAYGHNSVDSQEALSNKARTLLSELRNSLKRHYVDHQSEIEFRIPRGTAKPVVVVNPRPRNDGGSVQLSPQIVTFFAGRSVPVSGIDEYVELGHSPDWIGWREDEISFVNAGAYTLPRNIEGIVDAYPLPIGRKQAVNWGLFDYTPIIADSGERLILHAKTAQYGVEYALLRGGGIVHGERGPFRAAAEKLFTLRRSPLFHAMVCHVAVLTEEPDGTNRLLLCRRSPTLDYFPSNWSASIEEHMMYKHFDPAVPVSDTSPFDTVRRGMLSELKLNVPSEDIRLLSFGVEWNVWCVALCFVATVQRPFSEVTISWAKADDRDEAAVLDSIDTSEQSLQAFLNSSAWKPSSTAQFRDDFLRAKELARIRQGENTATPLHPTSRPRIAYLLRHLRATRNVS